MTISLPIFQTGPPLFASSSALVSTQRVEPALVSGRDQGDFAADIFLQQLLRVEQIVFVVLLDDAELVGAVSERKCTVVGIDGRGHAFKSQRENAGLQVDLADVANQGEIAVVNRERKIDLIFVRWSRP